MQPNQNTNPETNNRTSGLIALAIIGFIALVCLGMYLAVYSARFVPGTISRIGAAAVALSSVFTPAATSTLAVVPSDTASTTISFGDGTTTATTTTTTTTSTNTGSTGGTPTAGTETSGTYPLVGTTGSTGTLSGLPDIAVTITAVGYLTSASTDSFVAATVVPHGARPAVKFTVRNVGTNLTGSWRFSAVIPTQTQYVYQSLSQQSLNPGDSIDYTLGFDQAISGSNQTITISTNFDHAFAESNLNNNNVSAQVTVLGS